MRLSLPPSKLPTRVLDQDPLQGWAALIQDTKTLRTKVATTGALHDARPLALAALSLASEGEFLQKVRNSAPVRRAVLVLWAEDGALAEKTLTKARLQAVAGPSAPLSTMGKTSLLSLYLTYFTSMNRWRQGLRNAVEKSLRHHLQHPGRARLVSKALTAMSRENCRLISKDGPSLIAKRIAREKKDLDTVLGEFGLDAYRSSEFGAEIAERYFLKRIDLVDPQGTYKILDELRASDSLFMRLPSDGRLLGHHAVEKLALRAKPHGASDHWMGTILAIAGDPRFRHSDKWTRWWGSISQDAQDITVRWLGRQDLKLFLDAYERFIDNPHLDDARRMFEDRKVFIEGLLELDLVRETRLFIGEIAGQEIRASAGAELAKTFTSLEGSRAEAGVTAVVAIDCGDFQVVEGSHNFRLWVYTGARVPELFDRSQEAVPLKFFRTTIPAKAAAIADDSTRRSHIAVSHQGFSWQAKALKFLHDRGVSLPIQRLTTAETFEEYCRRHGTPVELL